MSLNEAIGLTLRGQVQHLVDRLNEIDRMNSLTEKERIGRKKAVYAEHIRQMAKFGWVIANDAHKLNQKEIRKERREHETIPTPSLLGH